MQPLLALTDFAAVAGAVGVFVGIQQMEYGALAAPHLGAMGAFAATGSPFSVAAGRMSFTYGLKGAPLGTPGGRHHLHTHCSSFCKPHTS